MAKDDPQLQIEIVVPDKSIKKTFSKVNKEAGKSGRESGKKFSENFSRGTNSSLSSFKSSIDALKGSFTGLAAALAIVFSGSKIVESANVQEDAVRRVENSLRRVGEFSVENSKDLQEFASSIQEVTRFGDELVLSQVTFAQGLGATKEQSKQAVLAATDLASALNIDLNSATRNIAKTLGGYAGELGEVIPALKNLTKEQLQSGEGISLIAERYRGFAQRDAKSTSGAFDQIANSAGDLVEKVGLLITQHPVFKTGLNSLKIALDAFNKALGTEVKTSQSVPELEKELSVVNKKVEAQDRLLSKFREQPKLVQKVQVARGKLAQIERERNRLLVEQITLESQVAIIKKQQERQAAFKESQRLDKEKAENQQIITTLQSYGLLREQLLTEQKNKEQELLRSALEKKLIDRQAYNNAVLQSEKNFQEQLLALKKKGDDKQNKQSFDANRAFGSIVASSTTTLIKSMLEGQKAGDAFKDFILGSFGQLATQLGQFYIATGIAQLKLFSLDPTGTIAAGVALVALGQLLSSFQSKGLSGADASSGGYSSEDTYTSFPTNDPLENDNQERREPTNTVNVNIHGFVGNSKEETTFAIVDAIKELRINNGVTV